MNYKTALKNMAQKLQLARLKEKLTVEELALKSGLTVYKIKKIESGKYNFMLKDLDKISKVLNFDITLNIKNNP